MTLKAVHVLSIIVWIGGMVFTHFFQHPAIAGLEAPVRLRLVHGVLGRFVQAELAASLLTLVSGVWMLGRVAKQVVQSGGSFEMPLVWTVMAVLGVTMVAVFMAQPRRTGSPCTDGQCAGRPMRCRARAADRMCTQA